MLPALTEPQVHSGRVMGCSLHLVVVDGERSLPERIVDRLVELESSWSRFVASSEISRLNQQQGKALPVSAETIRLVESMMIAHCETEGLFDPTLVVPVVEVGYGASLVDPMLKTVVTVDLDRRGRTDAITIDRTRGTVCLPVGTALDPGGIGKGLAADLIVEEFVGTECRGLLVSIGGDVVVSGDSPTGDGWVISVLDPTSSHEVDRIHLMRGAVATSSTERRVFERGHHLIDPSTLASTSSNVRGATVVAGSGMWAEVLTKPLMIEGVTRLDALEARGLPACVTTMSGRHMNERWTSVASSR